MGEEVNVPFKRIKGVSQGDNRLENTVYSSMTTHWITRNNLNKKTRKYDQETLRTNFFFSMSNTPTFNYLLTSVSL